jgi:hypothetical protein
LKSYIGVKLVKAQPMSRLEYNKYRGWNVPEDENPEDEGYLVEYSGSDSNHKDHEGYISWCPKEQFEEANRSTEGMTFGHAVEAAKKGMKIARRGWNGKGMFVFLVPGSEFKVNRPPLLGMYEEGTPIKYHAHLDMKAADGQVVPWLASQSDVLAEDWEIVE